MKSGNISKIALNLVLILSITFLLIPVSAECQLGVRTEARIPDIPGYVTIKCDLHMHTVFSDGTVWPRVRVQEAWMEGLDAISITDHIEYLPHEDDVSTDLNRSYELAAPSAKSVNMMFIRGTEITRDEPEAHHNALFIKDANALNIENFVECIEAAADQGAFIMWNHPGWKQPGNKSVWYDIQNEIWEKGWLHGIEVVNTDDYYPNAHKWCLEKNMTMLGCSDVHEPINMSYDLANGEHRPITLVFAREKTEESMKEALFDRRTAVYWRNILIGEEKFLKPIFTGSIEITTPEVNIQGTGGAYVQIKNNSDIKYELAVNGESEFVSMPGRVILYPGKTVLMWIRSKSETLSGLKKIRFPYIVENLYVQPSEGMPVELSVNVRFQPAEGK
ncbi:MAG: histidinol-phosphatase [bacterium]|nr:histidinol-phosphatase [bacterium]